MVAVKQLKDKSGTNFQPIVPDKIGYIGSYVSGSFSPGTQYTASESGYIRIQYNQMRDTVIHVDINGDGDRYAISVGGDTSLWQIQYIPIRKNQTFKITTEGNVSMQNISLFGLQGGGGLNALKHIGTTLSKLFSITPRGCANGY